MFKNWIEKVMATVPYIGNLVELAYRVKSTDKALKTTKFVFASIEVSDGNIVTRPLLFTASDIKAAVERVGKYLIGDNSYPISGYGKILSLVLANSVKKAKQVVNVLLCLTVTIDGVETKLLLTQAQYQACYKRYNKTVDRLEFRYSFKQKIAMLLDKIFGNKLEVWKK